MYKWFFSKLPRMWTKIELEMKMDLMKTKEYLDSNMMGCFVGQNDLGLLLIVFNINEYIINMESKDWNIS